jgi:hypothetical protein
VVAERKVQTNSLRLGFLAKGCLCQAIKAAALSYSGLFFKVLKVRGITTLFEKEKKSCLLPV